jgi:hypothetical protein
MTHQDSLARETRPALPLPWALVLVAWIWLAALGLLIVA